MKLLWASLIYLIMATVLGLGLYEVSVKGRYWLFAVALVIFCILFAKIGCLPPKTHHH